MKLKNLAKNIRRLVAMRDAVDDKIDDLYNKTLGYVKWNSQDERLDVAWKCIDKAIRALEGIKQL